MKIATVTILTDAGPVRINQSDYDANSDQYKLYDPNTAVDPDALRDDGPTIAEFIASGYPASKYPPHGYASKSTVEEIAAAVADETAKAAAEAARIEAERLANDGKTDLAGSMGEAASGASTLMVMKEGKKHIVVDPAGVKVERDGIDQKGYASEQDAWNAILALPR